jgi:hypothetical protein
MPRAYDAERQRLCGMREHRDCVLCARTRYLSVIDSAAACTARTSANLHAFTQLHIYIYIRIYISIYLYISQYPGVLQHALFQCELRSMRREDGLSITQLQYAASVNSSTQHYEHLAYCSTHFFSVSSAACDATMPSPHRSNSEPPPTTQLRK